MKLGEVHSNQSKLMQWNTISSNNDVIENISHGSLTPSPSSLYIKSHSKPNSTHDVHHEELEDEWTEDNYEYEEFDEQKVEENEEVMEYDDLVIF